MTSDVNDVDRVLQRIRAQARDGSIRVTAHAQQAMIDEDMSPAEVRESISQGRILENYPDHLRGACCLLFGATRGGRPLRVVCTSSAPLLIVITVYEPMPPKWVTATQRRSKE